MKTRTIKEVKAELKALAQEIKAKRGTRKSVPYGYVPGLKPLVNKYRHLHIAYCLRRGVPYELIEAKTREDNKPSFKEVNYLLGTIIFEEEADAENVCCCA